MLGFEGIFSTLISTIIQLCAKIHFSMDVFIHSMFFFVQLYWSTTLTDLAERPKFQGFIICFCKERGGGVNFGENASK